MKYLYWLIGLVILVGVGWLAYQAAPRPVEEPTTQKVFVYYTLLTETDMDLVAVEREVPVNDNKNVLALEALRELVKGPTDAEQTQGIYSSFNDGTEVNSVALADGVAIIDFNETFDTPMGGSARVRAISQTLLKTVQQFDQATEYTLGLTVNNGERDAVLEP
ncbi:TPA: hypothetical protein DHW58_02635 [Patescibacteria group bacterium]|uniref:Spore germination protein-like protein n=2 Tax=Bacteria division Kazan-3B-28 TaxID=1798534 RepID=A0A0G1X7R4_UNCK3|nr:MAG: Spore germination protein-like protein [candidate division Kazan bacterium GW2011_GWA1_50_15]KKW25565.1 MAG: Spore germination protein-like protein [candidate division Kazan bacterium GW2011_GWC1_52_13]KKW26870.1 MAG: Spore germination protein-like protein [candidate division Kazan bacterium GW2011_GWB1_52_7]HAV65865.1 hypothetical protein [Patescibacteria group bacterium]HCL47856.1 hypothetical protein [Patescibacteria group bacterium]